MRRVLSRTRHRVSKKSAVCQPVRAGRVCVRRDAQKKSGLRWAPGQKITGRQMSILNHTVPETRSSCQYSRAQAQSLVRGNAPGQRQHTDHTPDAGTRQVPADRERFTDPDVSSLSIPSRRERTLLDRSEDTQMLLQSEVLADMQESGPSRDTARVCQGHSIMDEHRDPGRSGCPARKGVRSCFWFSTAGNGLPCPLRPHDHISWHRSAASCGWPVPAGTAMQGIWRCRSGAQRAPSLFLQPNRASCP